jgi:hypothetical protein
MLIDSIDLTEGSDVKNLRIPHAAAAPSNPDVGEAYYNTVDKNIYIFEDLTTGWVVKGGSNQGAGGGATLVVGLFDNLPTLTSFTYSPDGNVVSSTEVINGSNKVTVYEYNGGGLVSKIVTSYMGTVRTETFAYNANSSVATITAVTV